MNLVHSDTGRPSEPMKVAAQAPPGTDDATTCPPRPGPANGVESLDHRSPCISDVPTGPRPGAAGTGSADACVIPDGIATATLARSASMPRAPILLTFTRSPKHIRAWFDTHCAAPDQNRASRNCSPGSNVSSIGTTWFTIVLVRMGGVGLVTKRTSAPWARQSRASCAT